MNADTYLRRQAYLENVRHQENRSKGQPKAPRAEPQAQYRPEKDFPVGDLVSQVSKIATSVSDWVDLDSLASTFIPEQAALVGTLNFLDGANETYRQTQAFHESVLASTLKVGLAAASAVPGLAGNLAETALAAIEVKEGATTHDADRITTTVTRLATSLGADLVALGVGGPTGAAIVLAATVGRLGYRLYDKAWA